MGPRWLLAALAIMTGSVAAAQPPAPERARPFRVTVVDAQSGRGVPLVELATVNGIVHVTDSAGVIAFDEPGLMDSEVFFAIRSHGYTYPKDGFGNAGVRLRPARGERATVRVERVNIAQRLYRTTGQGIYRDSVMLGDTPPIAQPVISGGVLGQDSVQRAVYRGKIFWFWGDTSRASYPLGNFSMAGATSELPRGKGESGGGLDPAVGIDFAYFVGPDGFSRPMCPIKDQPGPVWCDGMTVVAEASGRERLLCRFMRIKTLGEAYEQGIAVYDDEREVFELVLRFGLDAPVFPHGNPVRHQDAEGDYFYFASPFPLVRCRAVYEDLLHVERYEGYTCLKAGTRCAGEKTQIERDEAGRAVYAWRAGTPPLSQKEQGELIESGVLRAEEALIRLRDAQTGKRVLGHAGTVAWNEYRRKWVMIAQEAWGTSMLGEIWYAEAPTLVGPWGKAVKIITHDDYSFYNVAHHRFFDQDGGRVIYLEGTYTMAFSGTKAPTPRYDYNQIMYSLDLADPRLEGVGER